MLERILGKYMGITLVGDTHGKYNEYYRIVSKSEYSIQLGDFGFSQAWNYLHQSSLDPSLHKVILGNHDLHTSPRSKFDLGDFGSFALDGKEFYFIRGGLSIDRVYRIGEELNGGPKTYWSQEELSFSQMLGCMEDYKTNHQNIVLSHVPPASIIDEIHGNKGNSILQRFKFHEGFRENTSLLCDELLKIRPPDLWVFGHHHIKFDKTIDGTRFVCLPELGTMEI